MIPMPWAQVPASSRVVLSSGRTVWVIAIVPVPRTNDVLVRLRDSTGRTRDVVKGPADAPALVLAEDQDMAVLALGQRFPQIEFLRSL